MGRLLAVRAQNFRCFEDLECELDSAATLFIGDNAQGKTSLLEAVCVLLRLQSPRTARLSDLVRTGSAGFGIAGEAATSRIDLPELASEIRQLKFEWNDGRRLLTGNHDADLSPSHYLAMSLVLVWMGNDDLSLVQGNGDGRRRFLDFLGSQASPHYRPALLAYDRALRSRNRLLKDDPPDFRQIAAYTQPLIESGTVLTELRRELVARVAPWVAAAHSDISENDEALALAYHCGATDHFAAALTASACEERRRRVTVVGPHRDDVELSLNRHPASTHSSEGQQRTIALALKLAQARLLLTVHHSPPLLLIDDVFGELDPRRRNALLRALPSDAQRLVTATDGRWMDDRFASHRRYRVADGVLTREN